MKNIITVLLCCLLAIDTTLHAMLYVPHPSESSDFTTIQRIPTVSLERIGWYIEQLPEKKAIAIKNKLSHSLTFNIALLPADIRHHIVSYMFNDQRIATQHYKQPLLHLCTELHQSRKIILNSSLPEEKQKKLATLLVGLPDTQKTIIHDVINPSFGTRLAYSGPIISADTLAMIDTKTTKKLFKKQDIIMVKKLEEQFPLCVYTFNCLLLTFLTSTCTGALLYIAPCFMCGMLGYCPSFSSMFYFISIVAKLSPIYWLAIVSTTIRKRDKSQKIVLLT